MEGGKKIKVDEQHTITPQAQLVYSRVTFNSFTEPFGSQVDLDKADSLRGRLGVSFDRHQLWLDALGKARRSYLYGIVNLYHELGSGSSVQLANVSFDNRPQRTWVGIGLGGSFNWNNDRASLYGELGADTNLGGDGSHATVVKGTVGLRVKW